MKSLLLISAMILSATVAQAAGRQEASTICSSMSFDSSRNACITAIGKYEYFDQAAINICKGMSFDSGKSDCVDAIGNRAYDAYETDNCARNSFDSQKTECLKTSGRDANLRPTPPPYPAPGCLSKQDLIFELQNLDRLVYEGKNGRARSAIYDLLMNIQRCP